MIIDNYTFDASSQTITFGIDIEFKGLQLITNLDTNNLIYNFAKPGMGGVLVGRVLTLDFDTTAFSDTDDLQIIYTPPSEYVVYPATEEAMTALKDIRYLLKPMSMITGGGSNRLSVDVNSAIISSGTITSVTTVASVTALQNIVQIGGVNAFSLLKDLSMDTFANAVRSRIT